MSLASLGRLYRTSFALRKRLFLIPSTTHAPRRLDTMPPLYFQRGMVFRL